jgi:DNA invertase Pin-like site-specific DNA recombinase
MPGEVTKEHCNRKAFIYIRQSSQRQVMQNQSSREVQRNLIHRARALGWPEKNIEIIDEDLGMSATGTKQRTGFEKLLTNIYLGNTGSLFFLYASRLARNGKEWHQTLEMCSIFNVLIIDRDTIYDPRLPNDRLWLGMQGSFSEYEVSQMQIRAREAILAKASKGKLITLLPAGFVSSEDDRIELDADQRIQQAIRGVLQRFEELASVRQVSIWYAKNQIELPIRNIRKGFEIIWRVPDYHTIYRILPNPLYAGIYMYPKTKTITRIEEGKIVKTSGHRVSEKEKQVLIEDLFPAYITKEQYYRNQQIIAENAVMKAGTSKGAPREGQSLLAGLLFCGYCGRKLWVRYPSKDYSYYFCGGEVAANVRKGCLSFSGKKLESIIKDEMIKVLQPQAIQAAILAEEKCHQQAKEKTSSLYYALEQAHYEADRIERQYNSVEPEKYLVSATLSQRWQQALEKVEELEIQYNQSLLQQQPMTEQEREQLFCLVDDLKKVWDHPNSDAKIKKRLVRLLIREIWVTFSEGKKIKAIVHWHGGVHSEYEFERRHKRIPQTKKNNKHISTPDLITRLAGVCDDKQIARILNRLGYTTDDKLTWSQSLVLELRQKYNINKFSEKEYSKYGLVNLKQAAQILNVSMSTVLQMIKIDLIRAKQIIKYAPWEIDKRELDKPDVEYFLCKIKTGAHGSYNKKQTTLGFDE